MGKLRAARRPIVLSSDDEGDAVSERDSPPSPKRPKRGTAPMSISENGARGDSRATRSATRRAASPKPQSKAEPKSPPAKPPAKPKASFRPINSFFHKVAPPRTTQPPPRPERRATSTPVEELDDDILDSSGDDHPVSRPAALPIRKRVRDGRAADSDVLPKGSQKFLFKPTSAAAPSTPPPTQPSRLDDTDTRPWNEKYGPVSLEELAVHVRKVGDVRTWLSDVFEGSNRKRLLLLKGPAGSGKTTTISLLSKQLGFDIHEWKNPVGASASSEGFVSVTAQFEDFVGRTDAFGSLAFDEPLPPTQTRQMQPPPGTSSRQKQLILVEEFPNTFTRSSSAVQAFRASVLNFLTANTQSLQSWMSKKPNTDHHITPMVMIISETLLSTNTAAADSFTAHRLLGPEILSHPGAHVIEFNPIAHTFMTKALELVVVKEARKSGRKKSAGPQVIQRLSELGDIRSACSSLEFLCVRGDEDGEWGAKITFAKKKGSKNIPMTKMEQESLEMVTQRESTLGIFHAVGKVVHNKRITEDSSGRPNPQPPQPPHWFPERRRPKESEVQVNELIDELGTDTQTFIASLHENYVLSCQGGDSEETMDSIEGCIDALSDADILSPDRFGSSSFGRRIFQGNFQGTTADTLRQDEMSFQTSVRGLLYHLPYPVKRVAPPPGIMGGKGQTGPGKYATKGSAYAIYYPTSLRIWRQQEELGDLLDLWISRVQRGELIGTGPGIPKPPTGSGTGGVDTWRKSSMFASQSASTNTSTPTNTSISGTQDTEQTPPILLGSGASARYEMLLERLPYLPRILGKRCMPSPSTAAAIKEIKRITSFTGKSMAKAQDDEDEDDGDEAVEQEPWATDANPGLPKKNKKISIAKKKKNVVDEALAAIVEEEGRNLVLSDDDIED